MHRRSLWLVLSIGLVVAACSMAGTAGAVTRTSTSTALTSSSNPSRVGEQVVYTATVTPYPDGGMVTFLDTSCGSVNINIPTGQAICTETYTSLGEHTITATYAGDTSFESSTSPALSELVSQTGTSTALISTPNPSSEGQRVTYTATVTPTPDAGTVTFLDGTQTIASCSSLSIGATGSANCQASYATTGSHSIAAAYSGDESFAGSQSTTLEEVVDPTSTAPSLTVTASSLTSSANPSHTEEPVTYTATVSPAPDAGTLTFSEGTQAISGCTALSLTSTGQASCVQTYASTGSHAITAAYAGDASFAASQSKSVNQLVEPPSTATVLTAAESPTLAGQVTYTATVTPTPDAGTVTFVAEGADISGCSALSVDAATGAASCQQTYSTSAPRAIFASYSGDASFAASQSEELEVQISSATALPANTQITQFKARKHTARLRFSAEGATGFQCQLLRMSKQGREQPSAGFVSCRSPQTYNHLRAGTYTFIVRGVNEAGVAETPARRTFKLA